MRTYLASLIVIAAVAPAYADSRGLEASEVRAQLKPVAGAIEHCYIDRTTEIRGAGHMDLVLDVSRYGIVETLRVTTPGLPEKLAKDVDACVRAVVTPVAFPVKKTFTTATVPYYFQRTDAPNAGPQESCWDPKGCHSKKS